MQDKKNRILAQSLRAIERAAIRSAARTVVRLGRHPRVSAGVGAFSLLGMVAAFALSLPQELPSQLPLETVVENLAPVQTLLSTGEESMDALYLREEYVQRGDTLASLLGRLDINDAAAFDFIRLDPVAKTIARQLRPGKRVTARTNATGALSTLYFPLNGNRDNYIVIERAGKGFSAREQEMTLETDTRMVSGQIRNSLFGATDALNIPDAIAIQMAEIFGSDIDFHRDLRKGDRFSLVYETLYYRGRLVRSGRILAAEFVNAGKTYTAFWFADGDNGRGSWYSADGRSLKKAFLRSPLEFTRISSGFTLSRFHPVLKTWRAHKGIDYAAPTGTRVRAISDGNVEFAGTQGGYGNMIILKHQGAYSTVYGHLNGFASNLKKGSRVSQGDIIGYVGQTGLATGPHLHYEFRISGQQVNPLSVDLPKVIPMDAARLQRFMSTSRPLKTQLSFAGQTQFDVFE
ncbi:MAG: peptidoglycan DD-metalloendopeptidase family protein [Betaproteobacteria bacterium]|nr:peptidoglycan DD-metalloendopeptidase family protein [Betaproteobacteria bacterium]